MYSVLNAFLEYTYFYIKTLLYTFWLFVFKIVSISLNQGDLNQGGLNKKEIQLNLCDIFSILMFNELYLYPS